MHQFIRSTHRSIDVVDVIAVMLSGFTTGWMVSNVLYDAYVFIVSWMG